MVKYIILGGSVHETPKDMAQHIHTTQNVLEIWQSLTLLARNEYICWVEDAKKPETRLKRILWMCDNLLKGKRRPCCWAGCVHR